jgi:hypothetical protein
MSYKLITRFNWSTIRSEKFGENSESIRIRGEFGVFSLALIFFLFFFLSNLPRESVDLSFKEEFGASQAMSKADTATLHNRGKTGRDIQKRQKARSGKKQYMISKINWEGYCQKAKGEEWQEAVYDK